jgi:hypothetical protein
LKFQARLSMPERRVSGANRKVTVDGVVDVLRRIALAAVDGRG